MEYQYYIVWFMIIGNAVIFVTNYLTFLKLRKSLVDLRRVTDECSAVTRKVRQTYPDLFPLEELLHGDPQTFDPADMDVIELYSKEGDLVHTTRSRHGSPLIDDVRCYGGKRYVRDRSSGHTRCRVYVEDTSDHDTRPITLVVEFEDFSGYVVGTRVLPRTTIDSSPEITYLGADYRRRQMNDPNRVVYRRFKS